MRDGNIFRKWRDLSFSPQAEAAALLLTLWLIARLVANGVLNEFYSIGAARDGIGYSTLAWRSTWDLHSPVRSFDHFFNTHISWIFWLPSGLSYLFPVGRIPWFAWFDGCLHAALGLALWVLLRELWPSRRWWTVLARGGAALAFALDANCQSALTQAHPEIAGPAFALLFFWALFRERRALAVFCFVLALAQREDMPFHLFGLLFLLAALDLFRRVPGRYWKPALAYAAASLVYGAAALASKYYLFSDWGHFSEAYTGALPFKHVTQSLLAGRFENLALYRFWIWGPGALALAWAAATRNPYLVIGWLAFVPWLLLSLLAKFDLAGMFSLHYGYPFIIAGAWPLLASCAGFAEPRQLKPAGGWLPLWAAALLLIQQPVQIYPSLAFRLDMLQFTVAPEVAAAPAFDEFERRLPAARKQLGTLRADTGALGLAPFELDEYNDMIRTQVWDPATHSWAAAGNNPERLVDSIVYFANSWNAAGVDGIIKANNLTNTYWLPGTRFYLSTRLKLADISALNGLFVPAP